MISSISRLQDKSSEVVQSKFQRNSRGMYSSNINATSDMSSFRTSCSKSPYNYQINPKNIYHIFMGDHNTQGMMTCNETRLTVAIANVIICEGISLNLSQKSSVKKLLDLERNVSKFYQPPHRKLTSKDLLDLIHDQNAETKLSLIKKEWDVFGFLFLGDGATIYRFSRFENIGFRKNLPVSVLELVDCQGHLTYGGDQDETFICTIFLYRMKILSS